MAFFVDLSVYSYAPNCGVNLLNIGWLDEENEFPVGTTSAVCPRPPVSAAGRIHRRGIIDRPTASPD
jgi:hypothetical protein